MKPKGKILSLLLASCLVAGLMPTAVFATGTDTGKAIQLVDSETAANIGGEQADNLYFGTYQQSSDGNGGYNTDPIKWRVLENADGQLFLLSDQNLDVFEYHKENESVTWEKSTMRSWLNGYGASENTGGDSGIDYTSDNFISAAFSEKERAAVADTKVVNDDNPDYNTEGGNDTTDKIFLLSIDEAVDRNYFPMLSSNRFSTNTDYVAGGGKTGGYMNGSGDGDRWWLRSPGFDNSMAAYIEDDGGDIFEGNPVNYGAAAVRPAFNLDLSSVLFTSAAVGGKSSGAAGADALTSVFDYTGNEWKLTLLDSGRDDFAANVNGQTNASAVAGGSVQITYSDAQRGDNEYVSALLCDSDGKVLYYGNIAQNSASGTAALNIPTGLAAGNYSLKVFSEQCNGDKKTDYASAFVDISLTVSSDTTAPALTAGSVTRDSETAATVKFTSDEAGTYYYEVVESGAAEPTIDTTGEGTACDTTEQTISLNNLSGAGAKDIYIVAKDAAGNVSQPLKITIPAYIAPSYGISASPDALNFGSKTVDYTEAPAAQKVTVTNIGDQTVTVNLPTSANYIITPVTGFENGTPTLASNSTATFTVQPKTGLGAGDYSETLTISGSNSTSASVRLSFEVLDTYTLTVDLNGGNGTTTGGKYTEGEEISIDAGTRSGYRFTGWTSSNGGTFDDDSSESTTFTMPANDTTITASWKKKSSGSSYSLTEGIPKDEEKEPDKSEEKPEDEKPENTETLIPSAGFDDVGIFDWYYEAVVYVSENGIMNGVGGNKFGPGTELKREMLATILWNMEGKPEPKDISPFLDVMSGEYYSKAIAWAGENGIISGYGAEYGVGEAVTRQDFAAILYRYAVYKGYDVSVGEDTNILSYADAFEISEYAVSAMQWACGEGIIHGDDTASLNPTGKTIRAEAASMLMYFSKNVK